MREVILLVFAISQGACLVGDEVEDLDENQAAENQGGKIEGGENQGGMDKDRSFGVNNGSDFYIASLSGTRTFHYLRHKNGFLEISPLADPLDRADASWRTEDALAPVAGRSCYSFRSENYPNHYIRIVQDFRLKIEPFEDTSEYRQAATFCYVRGLNDPDTAISWESRLYPGRFIRHRNYNVYAESGNTQLFRQDATWHWSSRTY